MYYACADGSCSATSVPLANQVTNPVTALAGDNNGIVLELPAVPPGGSPAATGALVFGIGTETNNQPPSTLTTYATDTEDSGFGGHIQTLFSAYGSTPMDGFLDSGSSLISFPANTGTDTLTDCGPQDARYAGLFCPSQTTPFSATNEGSGGTSGTSSFSIMSALNLINSGNIVFSDMAANSFPVDSTTFKVESSEPYFDWGMPFFLGRSIYLGFAGAQSSLGTGAYWAFQN